MNIRETSDVDHYMQYLNLPVALSRGPVVMEEAEVADCPPVVFLIKEGSAPPDGSLGSEVRLCLGLGISTPAITDVSAARTSLCWGYSVELS